MLPAEWVALNLSSMDEAQTSLNRQLLNPECGCDTAQG